MNGITLTSKFRNSDNCGNFRNSILHFIRQSTNSVFYCHNSKRIELLTRLCFNLSHLCSHKLKHGFQDSINVRCTCGLHEEPATHFLPQCPSFATNGSAFLIKIKEIDSNLLNYTDSALMHTLQLVCNFLI